MNIFNYNEIPDEFFANIEFETIKSVNDIIDDVKKAETVRL